MAVEAGESSVSVTVSGRESLQRFEQEVTAYLRELPRLLEEGHAGRHAVIHGAEILSIWDTLNDAIQAGRAQFGPEAPIFVKRIDPRDPERFALLRDERAARCQPSVE